MKTRKNLFAFLFVLAIIHPVVFKAQPVYRSATVAKPALLWEPVNLDGKGTNIKDGVEFYSHSAECNLEKINVVKLVNKNTYSVKIAYQMSPESAVQYVRVPASGSIEGVCGTTDQNMAKLVFIIPKDKSAEELQKMKSFMIASIAITDLSR